MLYTIQQLPDEPIFLVRILAPLNSGKAIYAIDMELLHLTAGIRGKVYRIDDLTRLQAQDFTISDAFDWLTGPVREDAMWRGHIEHIAAVSQPIFTLLPHIHHSGEQLYVPLFDDVPSAVSYTRLEIARHSGRYQ